MAWYWQKDGTGPFMIKFWFDCPCGNEWDEFRELKDREDAEKQLACCIECLSDEPIEPSHFEELEDG